MSLLSNSVHYLLNRNRLINMPCKAFGNVDNSLKYLYISNNNIKYIPSDCFVFFNNLQLLSLSFNNYLGLRNNWLFLNKLNSLTTLDLENCSIATTDDLFYHLPKSIESLYMRSNRLNGTLQLLLLQSLPQFRYIDLSKNYGLTEIYNPIRNPCIGRFSGGYSE